MQEKQLKIFLDNKVDLYNDPSLIIHTDPIQIPHRYKLKEDIEISGFITATIAWGNRKSIITNASKIMDRMDNSPYNFIMNHKESDLKQFDGIVHRTFNTTDLLFFIASLKNIYSNHNGLEHLFKQNIKDDRLQYAIHCFKKVFFEIDFPERTTKHISDPLKGSAAKRINMYLRWMIRKDTKGVDFGIWKSIPPKYLSCPLDVHSGNNARKLGLLARKHNDAKAVMELDTALRKLDPKDPSKYDFALFGLTALN